MNRRSFLETLAKAAAGFTILPAATTYGRIWRAERRGIYVLQYRANTLGIYEQLRACSKVVEIQEPLDIEKLKPLLYSIKRERNQQEFFDTFFFGRPANTIEMEFSYPIKS